MKYDIKRKETCDTLSYKCNMYQKEEYSKDRNYGIDLLRIFSMIMISVLHVLGHGGILDNLTGFSLKSEVIWLLEISCYCAVNIYALISGYVGYGRKYKISNGLYLYLQVVFYLLISTFIFQVCNQQIISLKTMIICFFPYAYNIYWYYTAYFCLLLTIPFWNKMIDQFSRWELEKFILILILISSILPTLFHRDFSCINSGYSFLWIAILYIIGGYIKKYNIMIFSKKCFLGYSICVFITWLSRICIEVCTIKIYNESRYEDYLIAYTSPTIVLCALFIFLLLKI